MDLVVHGGETNRQLLRRVVAGALDALGLTSSTARAQSTNAATSASIETVRDELRARCAQERKMARELRDLANCERNLDHDAMCVLLNAMARDGDKHAQLVTFVGRQLGRTKR